MISRAIIVCLALLALCDLSNGGAHADTLTDQMTQLQSGLTTDLTQWKFHQPDVTGGEATDFDDSAWQTVAPGFQWQGEHTQVWFRTRVVVPTTYANLPTQDASLHLQMGMDDDGEVYVNGKLIQKFNWDDGSMTLATHVRPGQVYEIAVRGINQGGPGQMHFAHLTYDVLAPVQPAYDNYVRDASFVSTLATQISPTQQARMTSTLQKSEALVDLDALHLGDWAKFGQSLAQAKQALMPLAPITRQYDVYYVGHAHIDMNWLWPWPETIDVSHRTWDSAMKLMGQFPDFGFVQSQPGAYTAIQTLYPAEFTKMQQEAKKGQWDPVGGLWDESDTDMPSGEGLARSLFLGQRYFKTNFGRYAQTGWLPDSFGHSWQMPQLMQEAGIENYYHMRCGDGIRYSWWESPDGSRVLKANTDSYDESIVPEQLQRPWQDQKSYGLKEAVVIFGVGDHGGGPTREQILQGKSFQSDPLLPKIHFLTADAYFQHLRQLPQTRDLPVVKTDLQYIFVGCYTTHADLKTAVRKSENNLYADEVFSSLAAMQGQKYPVSGFESAWKPTVFAQFHDIMCGSAIHSTYTWMHERLKPAFAFEQAQEHKSLSALTAQVSTRGAGKGETPIVVWNALSFPRSDAATLSIANAARYHSVRDAQGHRFPTQALDAHTLVFVARNVPAFGHQTYFLGASSAAIQPRISTQNTANGIRLENSFLRAAISPKTGLITELYDKKTKREMLAPGKAGNLLQVLGDSGSAWNIDYTGTQTNLTTHGAAVKLVANGPVCAVVRVTHTFHKSTFTQDITLYHDLPRLDIPTTVQWHEHEQLLKVAFPLNMTHPAARVGIPYGSIDRPDIGQENPGQKWMDVTETRVVPEGTAQPLDIHTYFNNASAHLFDGAGFAFDLASFPPAGTRRLGTAHLPFQLRLGGSDNIACQGQTIPLSLHQNTLYVLGAGAPGVQGGTLTCVMADGSRKRALFSLGDWVVGGSGSNEPGLTFAHRLTSAGAIDAAKPSLWIAPVSLPAGQIVGIILPDNPQAHIFALTEGTAPHKTPLFGLTVLNNAKYGSDTHGNVFRLTLLSATNNPDPNPDEGTQVFTYSLLTHPGDWRTAKSEQAGLQLNIPLRPVVSTVHAGSQEDTPAFTLTSSHDDVIAGALKHAEDGSGYILRLFETHGQNTITHLSFPHAIQVQETDLLERPIHKHLIKISGRNMTLQLGHDQIITLHIQGLLDAGRR